MQHSRYPETMSDWVHKFLPATGSGVTVLLLHEAGANENDLVPIGCGVAKGAALLSPRLPIFDHAEVRAGELAAFLADEAAQYGFDASKVYALGYSTGADLAASVLLYHPGVLAGAVLLRPRLVVAPAVGETPSTSVLVLAGQHDQIAPVADTEALVRSLNAAGAAVEVHWMNEGHELGPADFQAAAKWLRVRL